MNKYKFKITYRNEDEYGHYYGDNRHNVSMIAETLEQAKEKLDKIEKCDCNYPYKNILNWEAEEIIQKNQQQELERYKNIIDELETYLQRKYGEYVDMESDDAFVISLVLDTLRELKGE